MLVINIVLPVFLLIMLGWVLAYFKFVPATVSKNLMAYIYWAAGPAIIFSAISSYHISQIFAWKFWIAYPLTIFLITCFSYFIFKNLFSETKIKSITSAFSTTVKNTVIIGFPLLAGIIGKEAAIPMAITVIFFNCIMMPILVLILEINTSSNKSKNKIRMFFSASLETIKNPLVFSSLMGMIFSIFHIPLPLSINKMFSYLAASFVPCALFSVGIELSLFKLESNLLKTFTVIGINLIICPILAIGLSYMLKLSPSYAIALVILSAVPTAQILYVYVSRYHLFEKEVAAIISTTTLCSIFSIPVFIFICYYLWPSAFLN